MQCMVWNAWSCEIADMQTLCMKSFSRVILQEKHFFHVILPFYSLFLYLFIVYIPYLLCGLTWSY